MTPVLFDTQLLLWAATDDPRLNAAARRAMLDTRERLFSAATIWEIAIKAALRKADFDHDAGFVRQNLIRVGFMELPVTGLHAAEVPKLPLHHHDPFDRILVAQARVEGLVLLTADRALDAYGPPVRLV